MRQCSIILIAFYSFASWLYNVSFFAFVTSGTDRQTDIVLTITVMFADSCLLCQMELENTQKTQTSTKAKISRADVSFSRGNIHMGLMEDHCCVGGHCHKHIISQGDSLSQEETYRLLVWPWNVPEGHRAWRHWTEHTRLPISVL